MTAENRRAWEKVGRLVHPEGPRRLDGVVQRPRWEPAGPDADRLAGVGSLPLLDQVGALADVLAVVLAQPADDVLGAGRVRILPFAIDHSRLPGPVTLGHLADGRAKRGVEVRHLG